MAPIHLQQDMTHCCCCCCCRRRRRRCFRCPRRWRRRRCQCCCCSCCRCHCCLRRCRRPITASSAPSKTDRPPAAPHVVSACPPASGASAGMGGAPIACGTYVRTSGACAKVIRRRRARLVPLAPHPLRRGRSRRCCRRRRSSRPAAAPALSVSIATASIAPLAGASAAGCSPRSSPSIASHARHRRSLLLLFPCAHLPPPFIAARRSQGAAASVSRTARCALLCAHKALPESDQR